MISAKVKDKFYSMIMITSCLIVVGMLVLILGFVFVNGIGKINLHFLSADFDDKSAYIDFDNTGDLGIEVEKVSYDNNNYLKVISIDKNSCALNAITTNGEKFPLKKGDVIKKIGKINVEDMTKEQYNLIDQSLLIGDLRLKITRPGEGIFPLVVNTFLMILISLAVALPISISSAIYLAEYAKKGKVLNFIRFATGCLAGIPSIIYGLFGMLVFVTMLNMDFSVIAGACTLSIVLLPILIGQTEEALLRVPNSLREGSYALGRTKLETIFNIVLPNSISGITVGVLLSIGRIIAESAALLLTAGTVARIPNNLLEGASTLTVRTYIVAKETGDIKLACAMGIVAIVIIATVNLSVKVVDRLDKMKAC